MVTTFFPPENLGFTWCWPECSCSKTRYAEPELPAIPRQTDSRSPSTLAATLVGTNRTRSPEANRERRLTDLNRPE